MRIFEDGNTALTVALHILDCEVERQFLEIDTVDGIPTHLSEIFLSLRVDNLAEKQIIAVGVGVGEPRIGDEFVQPRHGPGRDGTEAYLWIARAQSGANLR